MKENTLGMPWTRACVGASWLKPISHWSLFRRQQPAHSKKQAWPFEVRGASELIHGPLLRSIGTGLLDLFLGFSSRASSFAFCTPFLFSTARPTYRQLPTTEYLFIASAALHPTFSWMFPSSANYHGVFIEETPRYPAKIADPSRRHLDPEVIVSMESSPLGACLAERAYGGSGNIGSRPCSRPHEQQLFNHNP